MNIDHINNPNVDKSEIKSYRKSYLKFLLIALGVVVLGSLLWLYLIIKFF